MSVGHLSNKLVISRFMDDVEQQESVANPPITKTRVLQAHMATACGRVQIERCVPAGAALQLRVYPGRKGPERFARARVLDRLAMRQTEQALV